MALKRIVPPDQVSELVSLFIQIFGIPVPASGEFDAVVGLAGMGEPWRIGGPFAEWEQNRSGRHFVLAGLCPDERCFEELSPERLKQPPYNWRTDRIGSQVLVQPSARHTKDQADWVARGIASLGVTSLLFMVSPYHIVRAYLTLLDSMIRTGLGEVVMIPKPIAIPPTAILPEVDQPARAMIPGEVQRIIAYQVKGDVASLLTLEQYLDEVVYPWLAKQGGIIAEGA